MMGNEEAMQMMEEIAKGIAMINGMKQQLVDAGWSPARAELMVIELAKAGNKQ